MSGQALALQIQLMVLRRQRGIEPVPEIFPLSAPMRGPLIFEGLASPLTIDKQLARFRPWSISLPWMLRRPLPPLLWRHQEPAGRIEALAHDARGQLTIRAFVTHELALRAAHFSVCATVLAYEMCADCAVITDATVNEVSITDRPCNPAARVLVKHPATGYDNVLARLQRMQALVRGEMRV